MSNKQENNEFLHHKTHIFEWVANYFDEETNTEKQLYQFDESSEYYDKKVFIVPFVRVVMNILNKEGRLRSFHMIPRGHKLTPQTMPRYTVDLTDGSFHVNGQMFKYLPTDVQLSNYRLIWFFANVKVGAINTNEVLHEYIRLYKLGLQANDEDGKNYQKVMIWNAEDEAITIQDQR